MPTHDLRVERSGREAAHLKQAKRHLNRRLRWWGLSALASLGALGIAAIGSLLWWAAVPGALGALATSGALGATAVLSWLRGKHRRFLAAAETEAAWLQVAEDAVQTFEQVDVAQLADLLGTDVERADALLHQLVGLERVSSRVTSQGRVVYSKPRVRVEAAPLIRARVDAPQPDELKDELEDELEDLELRVQEQSRRRRV